jgi:hypothetical protein
MDVPCPRSNSTDLQKVPLACEEALYGCDRSAQFHGVLVEGSGSEVLVEASLTNGTRQTTLASQSGRMGTCRIHRNISAPVLSFETFVVQIPVARAASNNLPASRQQNRVAGRTFRAAS